MSNKIDEIIITMGKAKQDEKKLFNTKLKIKILIALIMIALLAAFFVASIIAIVIMIVAIAWIGGRILYSTIFQKINGKTNKAHPISRPPKDDGNTFDHEG